LVTGDSAVEYACELSRTNDVTLNYRRERLTRPNPKNLKILQKYMDEGLIKPKFGVDILGLESKHGMVKVNFSDGTTDILIEPYMAFGWDGNQKEFL